jgi:hypothetical protein
MLIDDVVLTLPATLPYGGVFTGRATFDGFVAKSPGGTAVWTSFDVVVDDVIASDDPGSRAAASSVCSSTPTPQS